MLDLRPSRLNHPDSLAMIDQVQQYVQLYGGPDDDPLRPAEFAPPRGGFLIGYEDGGAVAMGGWTFGAGEHASAAKVRRMYVAAEARRHGHAAAVLAALEADAAAAGATEMILTTGQPQTAAVAFYRDAGYTDVAPHGFYADVEGAVHLGKALRAGRPLIVPVSEPGRPPRRRC